MFVCLLFVCLFVCFFGLLLLGYTAWKHALGCNNGCGSRNFSKVKWLAATVSCKVDWNTETVIIWGFTCTGGRRERKKKRKKEKKKRTNHICPCSRICKNIGIRTYFGSMTVESVGGFRHFAFCSLGNRLASFFT